MMNKKTIGLIWAIASALMLFFEFDLVIVMSAMIVSQAWFAAS